jgi:hypothetical protein
MGAFEPMGEIDIHIHAGYGMLNPFGLVQYGDWVSNVFYTDFIDFDPSMIPLVLDVVHSYLP